MRKTSQSQPRGRIVAAALTAVVALAVPVAPAVDRADALPRFEIPQIDVVLDIDARLDEPAWSEALVVEPAIETDPGENIQAPVRTECRLLHSQTHLYYGCKAWDPEPHRIRARWTDRDRSAGVDDTIGIAIDPFDAQLGSFVFDVNPLGVQNDRTYTEQSGASDPSWDALWESSGRIVEDGYVVEVAVPFSSLRFPRRSGRQEWGFSVRRYYPRDDYHRIALLPHDRSDRCRTCQNAKLVGFEGIEPGSTLEVTPTLTGARRAERDGERGGLRAADPDLEPGLTATWGMTPNLALAGTLNPDFSQVEADVAQLDVNRSFALFFPERRPFFLQGEEYFSSQLQVVHTRSIADPDAGLKLWGREGRHELGLLVARDAVTNVLLPGIESSSLQQLNRESTAAVLRYRRDVGQASTIGLLLTDRSAGDYGNRVVGLDTSLRLSSADRVRLQVLHSTTEDPAILAGSGLAGSRDDLAWTAGYHRETRRWRAFGRYDDIGEEFRADLGFLPRVGYRELGAGGEYRWHGGSERWFNRLAVGGEIIRSDRASGGLLVDDQWVYAEYGGPLQSWISTGFGFRDRTFGGRLFEDQDFVWLVGGLQPASWLGIQLSLNYDEPTDLIGLRPGRELRVVPRVTLRPGRHLHADLTHRSVDFDIAEGRLFEVDLSELRLVYQFDLRSFLRAIVQYQDLRREPGLYPEPVAAAERDLFGQLLFAYKLDARTALYLGYGAELEGVGERGLRERGNTVFLKVGYAWQPKLRRERPGSG